MLPEHGLLAARVGCSQRCPAEDGPGSVGRGAGRVPRPFPSVGVPLDPGKVHGLIFLHREVHSRLVGRSRRGKSGQLCLCWGARLGSFLALAR
eukprot:10419992-Heterocapsa_arctica.AAC.1